MIRSRVIFEGSQICEISGSPSSTLGIYVGRIHFHTLCLRFRTTTRLVDGWTVIGSSNLGTNIQRRQHVIYTTLRTFIMSDQPLFNTATMKGVGTAWIVGPTNFVTILVLLKANRACRTLVKLVILLFLFMFTKAQVTLDSSDGRFRYVFVVVRLLLLFCWRFQYYFL